MDLGTHCCANQIFMTLTDPFRSNGSRPLIGFTLSMTFDLLFMSCGGSSSSSVHQIGGHSPVSLPSHVTCFMILPVIFAMLPSVSTVGATGWELKASRRVATASSEDAPTCWSGCMIEGRLRLSRQWGRCNPAVCKHQTLPGWGRQ